MGKKDNTAHRARYTLEFKLEAGRLVKGGQDVGVTAKVLGMPKQTLGNWVRLSEKGQLRGAGDKPVMSFDPPRRKVPYTNTWRGAATGEEGSGMMRSLF